jgi:glutathione peroxidase-family protein
MNKLLVAAVFLLFGTRAAAQNAEALWDIRFYTIDSFKVDMAGSRNKPLALLTIDAAAPDWVQLQAFDSLSRKYAGAVNFVGILLNDAGKPQSREQVLRQLRNGNGVSYPITGFSKSKKTKEGDERHPLLYWLEEQSGNRHFTLNTSVPGQVFLVNERGVLYGVLSPGAALSGPVMDQMLTQSPGE